MDEHFLFLSVSNRKIKGKKVIVEQLLRQGRIITMNYGMRTDQV